MPGTTSYLDVAIATCFVSVTREILSQNFFVSVTRGAPV